MGHHSGDSAITPIKRFLGLVALEKEDITLIYLYAILAGIINLSLPLGIQAVVGVIFGGQISTSWVILLGTIVFALAFAGSLQLMQMRISERLQQRIVTKASFDFAFRIPRMKMEALVNDYGPELMNRFFDVMNIQKSISKILVDFSTALLQIIFGLLLLAFYHAYFALWGVFVFLLVVFFVQFNFSKSLNSSLKESKYKYQIAAWLEELARTVSIFKLAGYTDMHMKKTDKIVNKYLEHRKEHFSKLMEQYVAIIVAKAAITAGVLIIGSMLVFSQDINIGQFVASEIMLILLLNSMEKVLVSMETVYDVLTSVEKIGHITDIPLETDEGIAFEDIDKGQGVEIVCKNVFYSYPDSGRVTLKNINMHIKPGEKICIAGYPGSGKSTLIYFAASMLHNYEGIITFNDITLRNLNLISLRSYVGENLSKKEILNGTIEENISMGRDDISYHDIKKATDAVGLTEYIQSTQNGLHTVLVPEDITIPKSVVLKITLARSIAEKPHLFVLDDFLTGLEISDKVKIVNSLTGKDKFWTLFGASNDKVFAKACDRILILKDGEIIDSGTYDEICVKPYFEELFV